MARRRNLLAPFTGPVPLFVAGIAVMVAFLFQQWLVVRFVQVLLFGTLAMLAGKKIRWLHFIVMVSSITFFNLLTPIGELLVQLGPLRITRGALEQGAMKGFAIVGLVFISLFSVRRDLQLPGRFGGLLARLFYYFEMIFDSRKRVKARALVSSVDQILLELFPASAISGDDAVPGRPGEHAEPIASPPAPGGKQHRGPLRTPTDGAGPKTPATEADEPRVTRSSRRWIGYAGMALLVLTMWALTVISLVK